MKKVKIASGQGFWGDWLEAPVRQIEGGEIDYLVLDYLAEVTMSILAKQKERDSNAGYARDIVNLVERVLPKLLEKNIRIICNAGGMNPKACASELQKIADAQGLKVSIASVEGDNFVDSIANTASKEELSHLETNGKFEKISNHIRSANIYLGCEAIVEALEKGAQIVICGRVSDPSMVLAPLVHEFNWNENDWDKKASGTLAGHLIECGAQASGGNCSEDWSTIENLANVGFPIVEVAEDSSFEIYKHENTGGRINLASVKEQMVYEIGDPTSYITPDVIVDFTSAKLSLIAENRVRVEGVKGSKRPEKLKVSISYFHGYRAVGTLVYSWPQAYKKAARAIEILDKRISDLGLNFEKTHSEVLGVNACHGSLAGEPSKDLAEVTMRYAVQGTNREDVKRFTREVAPLVLGGPPFATAYAGGKGAVTEVFGYWPTLISRDLVKTTVELV